MSPLFNLYGQGERLASASECLCHNGLHIFPFYGVVEVVNRGKPVANGGGTVLLTTLTNYAMPLIRYEVGDIAEITRNECKCNRTWRMLSKVLGKRREFVTTPKGRVVHGELLTRVVMENKWIRECQFMQEKDGLLRWRIVPKNDMLVNYNDVAEKLSSLLDGNMVLIEVVDEIKPTVAGKRPLVVSEVPVQY